VLLPASAQVELQPTIQSLFDMIQKVSRNLITVIQAVPRLAQQQTDKQVGGWVFESAHVPIQPNSVLCLQSCASTLCAFSQHCSTRLQRRAPHAPCCWLTLSAAP
jgi:hypothetical protein